MEYKSLSEIATYKQGKQVPIESQFLECKKGMKRFVRIIDFTNPGEPPRYIEDLGEQYEVDDKCIIMIRYGSQTAGTVVRGIPGIIANNMFQVCITDNRFDIDYMYYYLSSPQINNMLMGGQSSSTMPAITFGIMKQIQVPVRTIVEQRNIASLLEKIDKKISNNEAINRNLINQCRVLYENLISNYEVKGKLSDLIDRIETGSRPKGGAQTSGIPSIGAEKIESFGVYDYTGEKYISEEFFEKLNRGRIMSGDVLLYKDGAYTGKTSMALNGFPHVKCAINEHVYKLNTNENLYQFFLYFTLDYKKNRDYIHAMASSKAAQPGLNQTELLSVDIVIPDDSDLLEFEKNVSSMMTMIASNAKEIRKLAVLRDSLLPKLMSGDLDVSEIEI